MKAAIECRHLTRRFALNVAVDSLNLEVEPATVFGFLGPNGAGKTTTIRLLLGLLAPTSGAAEVLGMDVVTCADRVRAASGALLEHNGLYERLTALENLDLFGRLWGMPSHERAERARRLLEAMDLWGRRSQQVSEWSRGMKQRLAIARALIHRPRLVFLDEPTAGLDPESAASIRGQLRDLADAEGVTVFLTTHNLAEAETLCDTTAIMREGRLVETLDMARHRQLGNSLEHIYLERMGA